MIYADVVPIRDSMFEQNSQATPLVIDSNITDNVRDKNMTSVPHFKFNTW